MLRIYNRYKSFAFFLFLPLSLCKESGAKKHIGAGVSIPPPLYTPTPKTTKGDYPLCTPIVCVRRVICLKFLGSLRGAFLKKPLLIGWYLPLSAEDILFCKTIYLNSVGAYPYAIKNTFTFSNVKVF